MAAEETTADVPSTGWGLVVIAWIFVCTPLAWGVFMTLKKAAQLFETAQ